jgi:hypothetical protein
VPRNLILLVGKRMTMAARSSRTDSVLQGVPGKEYMFVAMNVYSSGT